MESHWGQDEAGEAREGTACEAVRRWRWSLVIKSCGNSTETCILSSVKQIASPGWMPETSARGWCAGKTQRDGMGREAGGGLRMGNTCKSMADSCQCMAKTTTIM